MVPVVVVETMVIFDWLSDGAPTGPESSAVSLTYVVVQNGSVSCSCTPVGIRRDVIFVFNFDTFKTPGTKSSLCFIVELAASSSQEYHSDDFLSSSWSPNNAHTFI